MSQPMGLRTTLWLTRLSLRKQVFLLMLLGVLVAGAIMGLLGGRFTHDAAREEADLRGEALVESAVMIAGDYLHAGETERMERALSRLMRGSGIERIEVQDLRRNGVVTLAWRAQQGSADRAVVVGFDLRGQMLQEHGASPNLSEVTFGGQPYLWVTRPLVDAGKASYLGVMFSDKDIRAHESEVLRNQLLLTLAFTVLLALALYVVLSRTLRPITQLARHMREFRAEGGEVWTGHASSREVVEIATAYESLRQRLQQQMQAMRVGRELMSATLDTTPSGVLVVNAQGRVRMANRAARRQFLIAGEQDQGDGGPRIEWLLPELDGRLAVPGRLGAFDDAQGWRCVAQALNGRRFLAQVHMASLGVDGSADHVFSVRDVTREEESSRQIEVRTQRLNLVLTLSTEGIVLFSAQRHLAYANPQMQQYLASMDAGYLTNLPLQAFERLLIEASVMARPYVPIDEQEPAMPLVFALKGQPERVLTRTWRLSEAGDNELVVFFQDVTEQETVARLKSEFLSAAAHELRTPLTSILGFSDLMLQHELPPEEQRELLQTIRDQSALLVNIINEMLDLSRIESRQGQDFKPRACLVQQACRLAAASVHPPGDTRQVAQRHDDDQLQVWADPEKLHQVLVNLLSNAYKFSPGGGVIELSSRRALRGDEAVALIEVRDHGLGMSEAELAHVFERFFRADKSGHIPGTGLGLSLVKQIVELSGGRVRLSSRPGEGTRVEVELPLLRDAAAQPTDTPVADKG